jgi:hypothetical protein
MLPHKLPLQSLTEPIKLKTEHPEPICPDHKSMEAYKSLRLAYFLGMWLRDADRLWSLNISLNNVYSQMT